MMAKKQTFFKTSCLFLAMMLSMLFIAEKRANAAVISVNTVNDFNQAVTNVASDDVLQLGSAFQSDLLSAANGASATIFVGDSRNLTIDGGGLTFSPSATLAGQMFDITHDGGGIVTFQNMTIENSLRAVFRLRGSGKVAFNNVHFSSNSGLSIDSSLTGELRVVNCTFTNNTNRVIQESLSTNSPHTITIENSYFYANKGDPPAVLSIYNNANVEIKDSTFEDNGSGVRTGYSGGVISADQKRDYTLTIERCYFKGNVLNSNVGGVIALYRSINGQLRLTDSVFEGNQSIGTGTQNPANLSDGGALAIKNNSGGQFVSAVVSGCNFTNNYAHDNGGAILLEAANGGITETTLYNCTFVGNVGNTRGLPTGNAGAVQLYGATNTHFFFNTFYQNHCAGRGGAIGVGGQAFPTITNNIFIDNTGFPGHKYQNIYFAASTENVQKNNGNIGYDNGQDFVPGDLARNAEVTAANIFKDFDGSGNAMPITFGVPVGASGHTADRTCYMITPLTDEMYRTNSRTVDTGVYEDVRGFPREKIVASSSDFPYYPNAGAVEIYWTKFDPGIGDWNSAFDISSILGAMKTLIVGQKGYYIVTDPPVISNGIPQYSSAFTFPRNTLQGPPNHGFMGWEDDKTGEVKDINEVYYSRKQTYIAQWRANQYHVDFDLVGGSQVVPTDFVTQIIIDGMNNNLATEPASQPILAGFLFDGWYLDPNYGGLPWNFAADSVHMDTTLYAKWIPDGGTPPQTIPPPIVSPFPTEPAITWPPPLYTPEITEIPDIDDGWGGMNEIDDGSSEIILLPPLQPPPIFAEVVPVMTPVPIYTPSVPIYATTMTPPAKLEPILVEEGSEDVPVTGGTKVVFVLIMVLAVAGIGFSIYKSHPKHNKFKDDLLK